MALQWQRSLVCPSQEAAVGDFSSSLTASLVARSTGPLPSFLCSQCSTEDCSKQKLSQPQFNWRYTAG